MFVEVYVYRVRPNTDNWVFEISITKPLLKVFKIQQLKILIQEAHYIKIQNSYFERSLFKYPAECMTYKIGKALFHNKV